MRHDDVRLISIAIDVVIAEHTGMVERALFVVTLLAAVGCGLVGGTFFAFSTFIMRALGRLAPAHGVLAMQSINVVVINPWFMSAMFGTAALCAAIGVAAVASWSRAGAGCLLGGAILYVVGTIVVTIAFNVPRNDALAGVDPASETAARVWADYLRTWTTWNHVRTAAALLAAGLLIVALARRAAAATG